MLNVFVAALLAFAPKYLDAEQAQLHANSAIAAARETGVDADLLLAMAWVESRFSPFDLSYQLCSSGACIRRTHVWTEALPPKGAKPSWYCGVLQVGGWVSWDRCLLLRNDIPLNYMESAKHLTQWQNDPRCNKLSSSARLTCALRGYSGGYRSINIGATQYVKGVRAALWRFRWILKKQQVASVSFDVPVDIVGSIVNARNNERGLIQPLHHRRDKVLRFETERFAA